MRSPDITQLDFSLWATSKIKFMYAIPVKGLHDLRELIIEAIEIILEDMLQCTQQYIVHCLDKNTVTAELKYRCGDVDIKTY